MPDQNLVTQEDLKLIIMHLKPVKKSGFGQVLISVSNGAIVNVNQAISYQIPKEQVKMDLNGK